MQQRPDTTRRRRGLWLRAQAAMALLVLSIGTAPFTTDVLAGPARAEAAAGVDRSTIVEIAEDEVGASEGNERCKKYGPCLELDWCAMFVRWVWKTAGVSPRPGSNVATAIGDWAVENNLFKRRPPGTRGGNPQPGDLVVWGEPDGRTGGHVGLVESVDARGFLTTIEGNVDDKVLRRRTFDPISKTAGTRNVHISGYVIPANAVDRPAQPGIADVDGVSVIGGNGGVHIYGRGADGEIYEKYYGRDGWSAWTSLGGNMKSAPVAVSAGSGGAHVFARGADNHLYQKTYSSATGWSGWSNHGGNIASAPSVVQSGPGSLHVYALGANGHIIQKYYGRDGWSSWEDLGGEMTSAPVAVSPGPGGMHVFARGTNNHLYQKSYSTATGWTGWSDHKGSLASIPSVVKTGPGTMHLYVRATSGHIYEKYYDQDEGWSGWGDLGGNMEGNPSAVMAGGVHIYARGANNQLYEKYYDQNEGWSGWQKLGGGLSGGPAAVLDGGVHVYAIGTDHRLYEKYYRSGDGWSAWGDLGGNLR